MSNNRLISFYIGNIGIERMSWIHHDDSVESLVKATAAAICGVTVGIENKEKGTPYEKVANWRKGKPSRPGMQKEMAALYNYYVIMENLSEIKSIEDVFRVLKANEVKSASDNCLPLMGSSRGKMDHPYLEQVAGGREIGVEEIAKMKETRFQHPSSYEFFAMTYKAGVIDWHSSALTKAMYAFDLVARGDTEKLKGEIRGLKKESLYLHEEAYKTHHRVRDFLLKNPELISRGPEAFAGEKRENTTKAAAKMAP